MSGGVKPIGNWLCRAVEVITSENIYWIRLIICIRIIVSWFLVSSLQVITCLVDLCIFDYKIICNGMINHFFSTLAYPFFLFVYCVCGFLLLRWLSIYWCEQMRELLVVIRVMEISLLSSYWVGSCLSEFSFRVVAHVLLDFLAYFWILLNFFSVLSMESWCALFSFQVLWITIRSDISTSWLCSLYYSMWCFIWLRLLFKWDVT